MARTDNNPISEWLYSSLLRYWNRVASKAEKADVARLRGQRARARLLRHHLSRLIHIADNRLMRPQIGSNAIQKPHDADWAWRPELWRGSMPTPGMSAVETKTKMGEEITLFHDCTKSEMTLRQLRNSRAADLAPYGLRVDVFSFDGSFMSLAIDLPPEGIAGLSKRHLLRLDTIVEMEKPLEIFARLNVVHGPNTEQLVRELPLNEENVMVEFDLGYTRINDKRVEKAWIDLIFEGPEMNQVVLRDLTLSRRPRAEF